MKLTIMMLICANFLVHTVFAQHTINNLDPSGKQHCGPNSYISNNDCLCDAGYELNSNGQCQLLKKVSVVNAKYSKESFPNVKFNQCSKEETLVLVNSIGYAKEVVKKLITYASYFYQNDQQSEESSNLQSAISKLKCIDENLSEMNQECNVAGLSCSSRVVAYVNWKFGSTVHWCEFGTNRFMHQAGESNSGTVATLIHEVSHKCGTFDTHRIVTKSVRNDGSTPWSDIASTYESWAIYGFCYPNRSSSAFCDSNGMRPRWMTDENTLKIPMIVTDSIRNKDEKKKEKWQKMVDAGELSIEDFKALLGE